MKYAFVEMMIICHFQNRSIKLKPQRPAFHYFLSKKRSQIIYYNFESYAIVSK
jgi:hypothetical protein